MKKIWLFIVSIVLISCGKESAVDYVTLKGKLNLTGVEKLTVQGKNFIKEISVNEDGSFSDTLKVSEGVHAISNGNDRVTLFLRNGFDLKLDFKGKEMMEGIVFSGNGSETNNFMENKRSFYMSDQTELDQ